mmetsp:Transcript_31648/g.89903  ORF Transcript_31648/g.89903 Transcript_31648/m.89903 type:complete len:279 (-) Transcript_31648:2134-2970(-)
MTLARTCTTTPSSRCLATGALATTSKRKPSAGPGSSSPTCSRWSQPACMLHTLAAMPSRALSLTSKPRPSGSSTSLSPAFCRLTARTTSGRWVTRAHAARARRFTTTASAAATPRAWSTWTTPTCWRSGTSSSFSSTARRMAPSSFCRRSMSTLAWEWSASSASSKTSAPTTPQMSLVQSSRPSKRSPGPDHTRTRLGQMTPMGRIWPTESWLTTSAPSALPSPMERAPGTWAATTFSAECSVARCAMAQTSSALRRASLPSWWMCWWTTWVASSQSS